MHRILQAVPLFWIILACAFLLGLLFGSFLNVCIARLPIGESIIKPRSHCPTCNHPIRWYDNVPLLSWLLLRGHCRDCAAPIGLQYPAVELATGLWFAASVGFSLNLTTFEDVAPVQAIALACLGFLLIGLAVMDWQTNILPDEFTIGGTLLGLFFAACESFFLPSVNYKTFITPEERFIANRVFAAIAAFLLLYLIRTLYKLIRKRHGMGLGDAKMLALIAAFLGFPIAIFALAIAVAAATLYSLLLVLRGKATATTRLPFGSFLALGGMLAALTGSAAIDWYTTLLH